MANLLKLPILNVARMGDGILLGFAKTAAFRAGQVVGLTTTPALAPRLYSIASGEQDKVMEILFTVTPNGALTPVLSEMGVGDFLYATLPHGGFVHDGADSWFLAAGTGIAPFRSMIRSGVRPLRLLHGARTSADLYFRNEFVACPGTGAYVQCLTQGGGDGPSMRLTRYLAMVEKLPRDVKYYICGNPNMVVDVRALLIDKGVPFENILTEIYF